MRPSEKVLVTHLSRQILEDGGAVNCCCSSNSAMAGRSVFQMSVNTTHWKLEKLNGNCIQTVSFQLKEMNNNVSAKFSIKTNN